MKVRRRTPSQSSETSDSGNRAGLISITETWKKYEERSALAANKSGLIGGCALTGYGGGD